MNNSRKNNVQCTTSTLRDSLRTAKTAGTSSNGGNIPGQSKNEEQQTGKESEKQPVKSKNDIGAAEAEPLKGSDANSRQLVKDPINMATGAFVYEDNDFALPDMAGDFLLIRRYVSGAGAGKRRSLGKRWTFSADSDITRYGDVTTVTLPDGTSAEFVYREGTYRNKRGGTQKYTLIRPNDNFIFTDNEKELVYQYGKDGKILQITDRNGNTATYMYNSYGLEKIQLASGFSLTFTWKDMKVATVTDNTDRTVKYDYQKGLLTRVTRCDGSELLYTYDEAENLISLTDSLGCEYIKNQYDETGRVIRQQQADGGICTICYQDGERTNILKDLLTGTEVRYIYDERMDIICVSYPDGSSCRTELDIYGNIVRKTDRCGATTEYVYDIHGHLLKTRYPSGLTEWQEYVGNNRIKAWDNTGRQTICKYDERGNVIEVRILLDREQGLESVTAYEYDSMGRIIKITENDMAVYEYRYAGCLPYPVKEILPDGTHADMKYDSAGRLAEKSTGEITERYTYTAYNKRKTYTDGEGGITTYSYDVAWRLVKKTGPGDGEVAGECYDYDSFDRLIARTDACGRTVSYQWNPDGDVTEIRKHGGREEAEESIRYEYDSHRNPIRIHIGTYGCHRYFYDKCGRIIKKVPAVCYDKTLDDGAGYTYERDGSGRIITARDPYGNRTDHYTYDLHGNVTCHRHYFPQDLNRQKQEGQPTVLPETRRIPGDIYIYNTIGWLTAKKEFLTVSREGTPLYAITMFYYDRAGNLIRERAYAEAQPDTHAPSGSCRIIDRTYDLQGNLIRVSDNTGACVIYEYDIHGRMVKEKKQTDDAQGTITEYQYDKCGRLTAKRILKQDSQEQKTGCYQKLIEDSDTNPAKGVRKGRNRFISFPKKEKAEQEYQKYAETGITYDVSGNPVEIRHPEGLLTRCFYDASGKRISCIFSDGTVADPTEHPGLANTLVVEYEYDAYGFISGIQKNGIAVRRENDAFGNCLSEIYPDGGTAMFRYDCEGHCLLTVSPKEYATAGEKAAGTVTEYDFCGRPVRILSPQGIPVKEIVYDSRGLVLTETDADGGCIRYTYNAGGRRMAVETAGGVREEYSYNAFGDIQASASGKEITTYETDLWGRITSIHAPEQIWERYAYDYMGQVVLAVDGEGRQREYNRDALGQIRQIVYADGIREFLEYDRAGRLIFHRARSGNCIEYTYDVFGNILEERAGIRMETGREENCCGTIGAEPDRDPEEREKKKQVEFHSYRYTPDGRLIQARGGGICYRYEYDVCGRLVSKAAGGRELLRYTYDFNGNVRTITDGTGKTTNRLYDCCDRLLSIQEDGKTLAEYSYTRGGKVSEIVCGDIVTSYGYDPDGNITEIRVLMAGTTVSHIGYAYDDRGNCIRKDTLADGFRLLSADGVTSMQSEESESSKYLKTTNSICYTYDGVNRLTKVTAGNIGKQQQNNTWDNPASVVFQTLETYEYDKAGNRIRRVLGDGTTETYAYGILNELQSINRMGPGNRAGTVSYTYDMDGNMISDGRGMYRYDGFGHMTEAVMEEGGTMVCRYDAEGLRHEMEENGRLIRLVYSGRDVANEEEEERGITRYIRGNGRLVASDCESARTYYHYASDRLGSITHVLAGNEYETPGTLEERILCWYRYDSFGNTTDLSEQAANRYRFTGEMYDGVTGQYYLRARYYNPVIGRFTQMDGYHGDGLNLYAYVGNNPVKYVDPNGQNRCMGVESGSNTNKLFKNQSLLDEHYDKHGQEIADVLGDSNYSIDKYLDDANYIINNGTYAPELNGYVSFMSGKKYGFVGLNRTTGDITTFHVKNISELIKKAPSLGFER
ncbi:MAG: hypothetical protein HFI34_04920 [Lachnospiraceae bacterium]|nr:hypothetical protein [Lachnospiraceae bacterium]